MAKFTYRMQNILDIKQKLEEQEKIAFATAMQKFNEEQDKLSELLLRRAKYEKRLREQNLGTLNLKEIKTTKAAIASMKVAIRDQMIAVSKAQKNMDIARKRLNDVMMERKMHEKLREKAFDAFVEELNHEESKLTDELVSYTFGHKEQEV